MAWAKVLLGHSTQTKISGTTLWKREPLDFMVQRNNGRPTEADTPTIRLGATPSGLTSAHLHHLPHFFTGRMPFLPPNQQCQSTEGKHYHHLHLNGRFTLNLGYSFASLVLLLFGKRTSWTITTNILTGQTSCLSTNQCCQITSKGIITKLLLPHLINY